MALKMEKELATGAVAEYWVAEPHSNKVSETTEIIMLLYLDQAAREAKKPAMARLRFNPDLDGCYHTGAEVYAHVKASEDFAGAVDA